MAGASAAIVTVVLAAGRGERLGGPKALLAWPVAGAPKPLAIAHALARLAAESSRVIVVTRSALMGSLMGHVRPGIDLLFSDAPDEQGPAGSIATAVQRADVDRLPLVLVVPVDTPPASPDTTRRLASAVQGEALGARPRHRGRPGHPVVVRGEVLASYRKPPPLPLRDRLHALGDRLVDVDVDDPHVLFDLNTPADVMGLLGTEPVFLR